jgi:hypothetical protein
VPVGATSRNEAYVNVLPATSRLRLVRGIAVLAGGLVVVLSAGCQSDEITSYTVPKEARSGQGPAKGEKVRLLAAVVPHGDRTWFLKLVGPEADVSAQQPAFDRFVQSVNFPDKAAEPIAWTVPEGWRQEPGNEQRYATFRIEAQPKPLELSVVALGREAGSLKANLDRWRGQIGLPPVPEEEIGKLTREVDIHGVKATLVDMTGTSTGKTGRMPPFAGRRAPFLEGQRGAAARPGLKYETPPGWKEDPSPRSPRIASFEVKEGDQRAEVTVTVFPGDVGGLRQNVVRWRSQVGLPEASDEEMLKDVKKIGVAGLSGDYLDVAGPGAGGQPAMRMLAVSLPHDDQTWFFKMTGSAELVGKQKPAFEAFVKSVNFAQGTGDGHE